MMVLENLVAGYCGRKISPSVSGHIKKGSMIAVVGINGIGKSTLLKTLAGSLPPISGILKFGSLGRPNISYLPQIKKLDYNHPLTVFDVVSMGCWPKINLFKKLSHCQKIAIYRALKQVNLLSSFHQYIGNLSGGQFQCMLFARILVQQSPLILLDEPFQGIDYNVCNIMIYAMHRLCKYGHTVIVVLHDKELINKYFSNILILTNTYSVWQSSL